MPSSSTTPATTTKEISMSQGSFGSFFAVSV